MTKFVSILALAFAMQGMADEVVKIGALAIGPRMLPAQGCGWSPRPAAYGEPANRGNNAPLYDVLGIQFGLTEMGRKFSVDIRETSLDQLNAQAADLVSKGMDFLVGIAGEGVGAAQSATTTLPILFPQISDPVAGGIVSSWWSPGGNTTGLSAGLVQITAQRLDLFKAMMGSRRLKKVVTLYVGDDGPSIKSVANLTAEATKLGMTAVGLTVKNRADIAAAIATFPSLGIDGFVMTPDSLVASNMDLVINWADQNKIPVIGVHDYLADWGAIATFGTNPHGAGRELAYYMDRILRGGSIGSIPVVSLPTYLVINLKAAACLGITVPANVISQANRIIQ